MDEQLHHIEETFQSGLNDFEETPRPEIWEHISQRLDTAALSALQKKYTLVKRGTVVLLLLLLCCAVFQINIIFKGNSPYSIHDAISIPSQRVDKNKVSDIQTFSGKTWLQIPFSSDKKQIARQAPSLLNRYRESLYHSFPASHFFSAIDAGKSTDILSAVPAVYSTFVVKEKSIAGLSSEPLPKSDAASVQQRFSAIKAKYARWSVIAFFSPDIAWYHLEDDQVVNNQVNANTQVNAKRLGEEEKHEFSYTMGALIQYRLNRHWSLQSGLMLANTNILVYPTKIYAQADNSGTIKYRLNTSSGYGYIQAPAFSGQPVLGDSLSTVVSVESLHYLSIPAAMIYHLPFKKLQLQMSGGVAANILVRARLETTIESGSEMSVETIKKIEGLKNSYWSALAGVGATYDIISKLSFMLAPTLRIPLEPINQYAMVKTYPMTFGVVGGLKYSF